MTYRNFKLIDLQQEFGLKIERKNLFDTQQIKQNKPSAWLTETLQRSTKMAISTEKALSEYIISPILSEVEMNNKDRISLFSGEVLNADRSRKLNGEVDFIFVQVANAIEIQAPLLCITEAKLHEGLERAIPQAAAQMIGAQVFNQKHQQQLPIIYGAITSGRTWLFLQLSQQTLLVDTDIYYLDNLPTILGIFQHLLKPQPLV